MKKKILSQMMILSFAFAGLFLVGNNVFAEQEHSDQIIAPGYSCTVTVECAWYDGGGSVSCTGVTKCLKYARSVKCDGKETECAS